MDAIQTAASRKSEWDAQGRRVRSTILLLIEGNQFSIVKGSAHAKEVYDKLKAYHLKTTRSFRVRGCVRKTPQKVVSLDLAIEARVCMLLRSLPASFDHIVATLDLQSDDDLTLDTVKSKLSDEYYRQQERDGGAEGEKAMRSTEQKCENVGYHCNKPGHLKRHCRSG